MDRIAQALEIMGATSQLLEASRKIVRFTEAKSLSPEAADVRAGAELLLEAEAAYQALPDWATEGLEDQVTIGCGALGDALLAAARRTGVTS